MGGLENPKGAAFPYSREGEIGIKINLGALGGKVIP